MASSFSPAPDHYSAQRKRCSSRIGAALALLAAVLGSPFTGAQTGAERAATSEAPSADYIGTARCAGCHQSEYAAWRDSHHDLAMQKPAPETVLGNFDNAVFEHYGVETKFSIDNDRYLVTTDGPDGELTEYEVAWVFGVYPLQQYLLPLDDGRLQALSIAWDSRPLSEGGQRWYHLYPDEAVPAGDPLHWTGPYQNWNTRCAECHSTDVRKNYDASARRFDTTFFEEDVGCEACHGPGSRHLELAQTGSTGKHPQAGFPVNLAARGAWAFPEGADIAKRQDAYPGNAQIDTCGRCHARRGALGDYRHGQPLSDTHRLALLGAPLYHPDGQILDEVYVYGSFVQSKMHQAGVVCSNCHEPHSNQLRAEGNGVCAQCHKSAAYDTAEHHGHPAASNGAQCVACHMPATTYMGVDARRDHSMRIPRPDLTVMTGAPNACTGCHSDQSADWALQTLRERGITFRDTGNHPAVAMARVSQGDNRGVPRLLELARNPETPAIWRATALERSAGLGEREALTLARDLLTSTDPLLRASAVRSLAALPAEQRFSYLMPLAQDPVAGVRLDVARNLADIPLDRLLPGDRAALLALFDEYKQVHLIHADMPAMNLQLGVFSQARGDRPAAESAYREALALNPQLAAANLNLADLLRGSGREEEARAALNAVLEFSPENGDAAHAMGLLEIRAGDREQALEWLRKAADAVSASPRHRYVYAIALHDTGDARAALKVLRDLHRDLPAWEDALLALTNYSAEIGDRTAARGYAQKLLQLDPANPQYRSLVASLRG